MENGKTVVRTFIVNYHPRDYKTPGPLLYNSTLYTCDDSVPAKYRNNSGTPHFLSTPNS